jgi:hypothetical protein
MTPGGRGYAGQVGNLLGALWASVARPWAARVGLAVVLLLLTAAGLSADPRYMVDYLLPRGGARGATVSVEFHGFSLDNPKQILFYDSGITAEGFAPYPKPSDGFKVKFHIAADCALGEHVLRVRTATGLSDAVTFWVSPFPTVYELETKIGENDSIEKARPVPLNSTVEGQILPGPDMDKDFYRVTVRKGQRISVEVEAARLGTLHVNGENDLMARILDATGKELGRNDDSALYVQDPVLSIVAPADGAYYVEIRQQIFYPPRQAWYRAHIGTYSRPTAIFPAGGQAGSSISALILGDPAGLRTESIALPDKPGNFDYFTPGGEVKPPSPNVLRVSPYPNVLYADAPTPVDALPAALNGILEKPGDVHTYRFSAKKGQAWKVRVYARTLGAPVDPKIWIASAAKPDNKILQADDSKPTELGQPSMRGTWFIKDEMDPVALFRPPTDGDYLIGIEDTTGAGGPDHVYRVEIEPVHDSVFTHITSPDGYQRPRTAGLIVPRGNRWTLVVQLAQGFGNSYKGELKLEAVGLPEGVTMTAPRIGKGMNRIPVEFAAAPDVEPQAVLIDLVAKPVDPKVELESGSRQSFALLNRPGDLPWHFVFLDKYALAITDPAPYSIALEAPAVGLSQSGELQLKVKLTRNGDFKGAVELEPDWLPNGVSHEPVVTIPAGKDEATVKLQANDKAPPGVYKIAMNATTTGGDGYSGIGRVRVSSEFVDLKVSEPYLSIDLQRTSVERGKKALLIGTLHQNKPFPGKASISLRQLPKGVKMVDPAPEITAKDTEVVFHVEADPDALAGLYRGINCEVVITEAGQTIRQHTGNGTLRVDEARATTGGMQ